MSAASRELKEITDILVSPAIDYPAILDAVTSLKKLFCSLTGFDETDPLNKEHITTISGQAIGPVSAAFCITDMMRTRVFLMGIKQAIEERLLSAPGRPVVVFYAGTGPFATLITPLTTFFSPQQLQVVLLEINPISVAYLQQTISCFQLEPYITGIVNVDASTYKLPVEYQPDILLSETMRPALQKEPQVAIVTNLLGQCNRTPVLIPGSIQVKAVLLGNMAEPGYEILPLKVLMEFNEEIAILTPSQLKGMPVFSEGITIEIPKPADLSCTELSLLTSIKVYKENILTFNECGLTIPYRLMDISTINSWPLRLLFKYETCPIPGFIFEIT